MEKKFKYRIAYKCESAEESKKLLKDLHKLGYECSSNQFCDYTGEEEYLTTHWNNVSNGYGFYYGKPSDRYVCNSKELFLALAAVVDSDEFYEGECAYNIPRGYVEIAQGLIGNTVTKNWRKATKEEIINYFSKQVKEETNIKMKKEDFTVEGNKYLLTALLKELISELNLNTDSQLCSALSDGEVRYDTFLEAQNCNKYITLNSKPAKINYKLPLQYSEAKQAFIDFYKEVVKFEEGKWYKSINLNTKAVSIFRHNGSNLGEGSSYTGEWSSTIQFSNDYHKVELATEEEITSALIQEYKKRYKVGDTFNYLESKGSTKVVSEPYYRMDTDTLWNGNSRGRLYSKGKWAEIVKEPKIIVNGYEAEFFPEYVKFGCANISVSVFNKILDIQKECSSSYTNRNLTSIKIGSGEFTFEQVKQIVNYYNNN